jgi:hypothetical protein
VRQAGGDELLGEHPLRRGLAVDEYDPFEGAAVAYAARERHEILLVGMRREAVQHDHLGLAPDVCAEHAHLAATLDQAWKSPQSSSTVACAVRTTCFEPVTVWAAPTNSISMPAA